MQLRKVMVVFGAVVLPALTVTESACGGAGSASTVTITETVSPVTVTVNIATEAFTVETLPDPTTTLTSFSTHTNTLSIITAVTGPVTSKQGPYSFAMHSGTTLWLDGKTPTATESLVIKTAAITVLPVPQSSVVPSSVDPDTSSFATSTSFKKFTETVTESSSTPSAKPFTGLNPYGWNSSGSTLLTVKVGSSGTGFGSVPKVPIPVTQASSYLAPRQVGAVIVATIEGKVVSWTNSYNGGVTTTGLSEPSTTLAVYPWNAGVGPAVTSLSSVAPTTVVGVYPWNPPVPESSTSAPTPTVKPTVLPFSSGELQPGIPSLQPSYDVSYMSSYLSKVHQTSSSIQPSPVSTTLEASFSSLYQDSSAPASTTSASSTVATPLPSCSSQSPFTIGFDDLPHFSIGNNPNDTDIPPIFNPYRKLYWESHFGYVPPPTDPFAPVSGKQLAVYRADDSINVNASPDAGLELIGEFGAGPRAANSAYWIDGFSVYLGCNNAGPSDCVISINGYEAASSTRVAFQTVNQPPCPGLINCKLAQISFNEDFRNLSGIQIIAAVDRRPVAWFMDELVLGWSNNTCEATTYRNNHQ